jgi:uncharacterized membrane protein
MGYDSGYGYGCGSGYGSGAAIAAVVIIIIIIIILIAIFAGFNNGVGFRAGSQHSHSGKGCDEEKVAVSAKALRDLCNSA